MRILLINPNTSTEVTATLAAQVNEIVGRSVAIVPVTGRFGARYIASRAAAAIAGHAALEALAQHVDGCDAVYLACFGDPALAALQEISPVPVVGMAEAACRAACRRGDRFAIVTAGALWGPILQELVIGLGLSDRLAAIRTIAPAGDAIARDPNSALGALAAACNACVAEDGADSVVLGGAALAGLASQIQTNIPVPIVCSVEAGAHAVLASCRQTRCGRQAQMTACIGLSPALTRLLGGD